MNLVGGEVTESSIGAVNADGSHREGLEKVLNLPQEGLDPAQVEKLKEFLRKCFLLMRMTCMGHTSLKQAPRCLPGTYSVQPHSLLVMDCPTLN